MLQPLQILQIFTRVALGIAVNLICFKQSALHKGAPQGKSFVYIRFQTCRCNFGTDLVQKIVAFIPAWLTDGLNLGSKFLTAYGISLLLSTMLNRDLTVYFLLGFFFVGYLGLDVTAVAIFAAILAVILTGLKYGKGTPAAAAAGAAAANADYDPLEDDDDL